MKMKPTVPYPLVILRGRLRLIGLSYQRIESIIAQVIDQGTIDSRELVDVLGSEDSTIIRQFELLAKYDDARRNSEPIDPIVLVLEGASATGKSMLALTMICNLGATRIISTDTVRQVLRGVYSPQTHPELYCHTYQAYKERQSGPETLSPMVRGYIAQCEHISPVVGKITERIVQEGAEAVVEGVHVIPGSLSHVSQSVVEVLINPNPELHKNMFLSKYSMAGLKSVSSDDARRTMEFENTRKIQNFMLDNAGKSGIKVIELLDYEQAERETCNLIIETIKTILDE